MITVKAINGSPESIPVKHFGSTFDGSNFRFFESEQEKQNFYASLPQKQPQDPKKLDISNADIDTLTPDQINKLKIMLGL